MNDSQRFDWLSFCTRTGVIVFLATWLLIERLHRHDLKRAVWVGIVGYVILPVVAYLHTRYYNTVLMFGLPQALAHKFGRRHAH